ncbi:beta strand repeat-containing protein [Jiella marina]|uniref:beta strand repeat-containing protein n=1 Tax=Jiella sp. LLJ827 TaxID=2917712 RepID=UPI0021015056|nr:calcium-binding protein [Jiella sp. LLJ827]MCQ0988718.1 pre-peptidase C-terminal domain-containing protein [Jiella sp. LLJ827]
MSETNSVQNAAAAATTITGATGNAETPVSTTVAEAAFDPSITLLPAGGWIAVWTADNEESGNEFSRTLFQRFDASGNPVGPETQVGDPDAFYSNTSAVPLADGGWMIIHDRGDIVQQRFDADGNAVGGETQINTVSGDLRGATATALEDGGWVVAWHRNGFNEQVFQQVFDAEGNAVGGEVHVNTTTSGRHFVNDIEALPDGGWVVVWNVGGGIGNVEQQRFDANGDPVGGETQVNSIAGGPNSNPTVTALADGGWVVTWADPDGDQNGIFQQRYDSDGDAVGSQTGVNTTTASFQSTPEVTGLPDGGWVVVWHSGGNQDGVYMQRFAANGDPVGTETLVNVTTEGSQRDASVTALDGVGWVVTWRSTDPDTFDDVVMQRVFAADIEGTDGNDVIDGTVFDEAIFGLGGDDTIDGGEGDDTVEGGAGADDMDGGEGIDTLSYAGSAQGVVVRLSDGTATGGDAAGDTFVNFENLTGSAHDDTLAGTTGANVLSGGAGNDTLIGLGGADFLHGGEGNDTFDILPTEDFAGATMDGGAGSDRLLLRTADDVQNAYDLTGTSFLSIEEIEFAADTGGFDENIKTVSLSASQVGGAGLSSTLLIDGNDSTDKKDLISIAMGDATSLDLSGWTFQQWGTVANNGDGEFITITGDGDAETITGSSERDVIDGGAGDDTIDGGGGNDTLDGGDGNDILIGDQISSLSVDETVANNTFETALNIDDPALWSTSENPLVGDSSVPHTTLFVEATEGEFEFFSVTLGAGETITLDVDFGNNSSFGGNVDTMIRLFAPDGSIVADDDDSSTSDGGLGSTSSLDSFLTFTATEAGTYVFQMQQFSDREFDAGEGFAVNVSVTGHAATGTATSGDDVLDGGAGDDLLIGLAGNDTLTGGQGDDQLEGGSGNDTLNGGDGLDTAAFEGADGVVVDLVAGTATGQGDDTLIGVENVIGSDNADTITGDAGDNVIEGRSGDDLIAGLGGADTMNGGSGIDTLDYSASADGVEVNLNAGTGSGGDAEGDSFSGFENVIGSDGDDVISDQANSGVVNIIDGGHGNDRLVKLSNTSGGSQDIWIGGTGTDTFVFDIDPGENTRVIDLARGMITANGEARDLLIGIENVETGGGNDIVGSGRNNVLTAIGDFDNVITGGGGADTIDGGGGNDTADYSTSSGAVDVSLARGTGIGGDAQGDTLTGIENLVGSARGDVLTGDAGDNVLAGLAGGDELNGGEGSDTVDYSASGSGITVDLAAGTVAGGHAEGDTLTDIENVIGSDNADDITGDATDNVIEGGAGGDTLSGGDGTDTLSYARSAAGVTVDLLNQTVSGGDAENDTISGFENVIGSDNADTITGDAGDNEIEAGLGDDTIDGGDGIDTASYAGASGGVTVDLEAGTSSGAAGADTLTNTENIIGSAFDDTLTGDGGTNVIDGGAGNDRIFGGLGRDMLYGGDGDDVLGFTGTNVNDPIVQLVDGGAGVDTLDISDLNLAALTVDLTAGTVTAGGLGPDVVASLVSIENVITGDGDDTIIGDDSDNFFKPGLGDDTVDGGEGNDTVSYEGSGPDLVIDLAAGTSTGRGTDTLISIENATGGGGADTIFGDDGANVLIGNNGADTLDGRGGDDTLDGGNGNDTITLGDGNDTATGGDGNDTFILQDLGFTSSINGGNGADTLDLSGASQAVIYRDDQATLGTTVASVSSIETVIGTDFDDIITEVGNLNDVFAGDGDDLVIFDLSAGSDTVDGGDGIDTLDLNQNTETANFTIDLAAGTYTTGGSIDTVANFENLISGDGNDTITGTAGANVIEGRGGNDTINAGDGDDTIEGGAGADTIDGGDGIDTLTYANSSAAVRTPLFNSNALSGGDAEGDRISNIEIIIGSAFGDNLESAGASELHGGDGNDTLTARGNIDLFGDEGDDILSVHPNGSGRLADATFDGGAGNDTLDIFTDGVEDFTDNALVSLETLSFRNLNGDSSFSFTADQINGFSTISLRDRGGSGDLAIRIAMGDAASLDLSGKVVNGIPEDRFVINGDDDAESITGSSIDDEINGGGGDDQIAGGAGDDTLNGGAGADKLFGGTGSDTASYAGSDAGVAVDPRNGNAFGGHAAGDTLTNIENLTGSAFFDTLIGNSQANILSGENGFDTLRGLGGDDELFGGNGNDTLMGDTGDDLLVGGAGADVLDGGDGIDTASYADSNAGVSVDLRNGNAFGGHAAGDTLANIENLTGSSFFDTLIGNGEANILRGENGFDALRGFGGNDELFGGNGNDNLMGDGGDDLLVGGAGGDVLDGGADIDTASYADSDAGVTIDLRGGTASGGHAQGDTLTGIENLTGSSFFDTLSGDNGVNVLSGGNGFDTLRGFAGDDTLLGGNGNDTLFGDVGFDTLTGGAGNDVLTGGFNGDLFVYENGFGQDTITDFEEFNNFEKIDLSAVTNITDFADLSANHLSQVGADAVITDGANTITLTDVNIADLDANDFVF